MLKALGGYQISQRRACVLIGVDPKTVRRERPPDHGAIYVAIREVAGKRRRFGYRRIGVMLERQGLIMNHKKLETRKNGVISGWRDDVEAARRTKGIVRTDFHDAWR